MMLREGEDPHCAITPAETAWRDGTADSAIAATAELGRNLLGAAACLISWRDHGRSGVARAVRRLVTPEAARAEAALARLEAAHQKGDEDCTFIEIESECIGAIAWQGGASAVIVVAGATPAPRTKYKASLELLANAALARVTSASSAASLLFWRERTAEISSKAAEDAKKRDRNEAAQFELEKIARDAAGMPERRRRVLFGSAIARILNCERWILAAPSAGGLRIGAASHGISVGSKIPADSAAAAVERSGKTLIRVPSLARSGKFWEDKWLGLSWIVLPIGPVVAVLASPDVASEDFRLRAENLAIRAGAIVRGWIAEEQARQSRALAQRLALRMFSAVDEERARIARDLHDDQAQLLAAVQIALEGGTGKARAIFMKVAAELRARTRELKAPTLGAATLSQALEGELARLRDAGIDARLIHGARPRGIDRAIEQLCWQVAREALANVARHSNASRVEVAIEPGVHILRMVVRDNGHGFAADSPDRPSMGLAGLRERLELMGGALRIESGPSGTILTAEIPEPA